MNMKKFTTLATSVFVALLVSAFAFTVVGCGGDPEAGPAGSSGGAGASAPVEIDVTNAVMAQAKIDMALASGAKVFIPGGEVAANGVIDLKTADVTLFAPLTFADGTSILNAASATVSFYSSASTITIGDGIFIAPAVTPENWVGKIADPSSMLNLKTKDEVLEATGNTAVLGSTLSAISAEEITAVGTKFSANTLYIIGDGASIDIGSADVDLSNTKITTIGGAIAVQGAGGTNGLKVDDGTKNVLNLKLAGALGLTSDAGLKSLELNGYTLTLKNSTTTATVLKVTGTGTIAGTATTTLSALDTTSNVTISGAGTALTVGNLGGGSVTLPGTLAGTLTLGGTGTVGATGNAVTPDGVTTLLDGAAITLAEGNVIKSGTVLQLEAGLYRANGVVLIGATTGVITTAGSTGNSLTVGSDSDHVKFVSTGDQAITATPSGGLVKVSPAGIDVAQAASLVLAGHTSNGAGIEVAGTATIKVSSTDDAHNVVLTKANIIAGTHGNSPATIAGSSGTPSITLAAQGANGASLELANGGSLAIKGGGKVVYGGTAEIIATGGTGEGLISFASTSGNLTIESTEVATGSITVLQTGVLTIGANTTIDLKGSASTAVGTIVLAGDSEQANRAKLTFTDNTSIVTTATDETGTTTTSTTLVSTLTNNPVIDDGIVIGYSSGNKLTSLKGVAGTAKSITAGNTSQVEIESALAANA